MNPTPRCVLTSVLVTGLLLGGVGLAQGRGGPAGGPAGMGPAAMHGGPTPVGLRTGGALPMLARLPIGTTLEVAFHDADPASGAEPVTTLTITVGVDSEAAFGDAFAEARAAAAEWEAAYLVVTTSEVRRTIDLPEADAADLPRRAGDAFALRLLPAGLDDGDTVTVELYDADPADGGNLIETLAFAYGADSAIGFRAAVEEALEGSAVAVVTSSPRSMTLDLQAIDERAHAFDERAHAFGERLGAAAERMGRMAERLGAAAERRDGAPMAPGMRGRR